MNKFNVLIRNILLLFAIQVLFLSLDPVSVSACTYNESSTISTTAGEIGTLSATIGWVYKTVNRKTYKRLFNYSTGEWIGDWILVS